MLVGVEQLFAQKGFEAKAIRQDNQRADRQQQARRQPQADEPHPGHWSI